MDDRVHVRCIQSRRVADDEYGAGNEYEMGRERAERYAAYFTILASNDAKQADPPENKMRAAPEDKGRRGERRGWTNRAGARVELDGTLISEP